jgi:acyl transferase domain-containing protein/3-hydroxymyristoyl/3-hydroxydecanoyl-(acyl carrier protein) dehydratase
MTNSSERIAIVGQAIRLPGAGEAIDRFWSAVTSAEDCSREVPPNRWPRPPQEYFDPRIANPDTVYSTRGYFLDHFEPDLTDLRVDPGFVEQLDTLFHIVLDVGNRAWRSSRTNRVDRARVGVVLGNICLPTAKANALCREYLGAEPRKTHPLNRYVAGLPAGVLAKALGLGGGNFTLDAACASSLYAIKLAADELIAGRADAMLAGGANGSDSHYTQMGFAQLRALSVSGRCSPFDAKADGLMVGEGAAIFVLKRLSDALRQGDTILATIAGIGLSNDMHGNLLAPAKEGQLRAMRKAYDRAGWSPTDVDLIECHATGTLVGDAVEFDSLRELWGEDGWRPGQCAIGSVKSTVGHLLTGAGAAATAKVIRALVTGSLPPQANFDLPNPALKYEGGPFRVHGGPIEWERRDGNRPRRAAVSGFGFGGVNAHLLLEEWTGLAHAQVIRGGGKLVTVAPKNAPASEVQQAAPPQQTPVAVVGLAAHFGPWKDSRSLQEHLFNAVTVGPKCKQNGWSLAAAASPPGYFIEELQFPIDRFRIPPKELEEMLPQQLLMLQIAAAALDDSKAALDSDDPNTGVFIGLGLDPNTTNYHLRWSVLAGDNSETADSISPALNANRVMGALGSIAASRIARAFHFGGPSHTVCSEEASAARALELAVRALGAGEIDRALVGGVDLAGDPRTILPGNIRNPGEGAAALVLKRLADAERDGDRVYAVITGIGVAGGGQPDQSIPAADAIDESVARACTDARIEFETLEYVDGLSASIAEKKVGYTGAASAGASFFSACIALSQQILRSERPQYWLHDRASGPRRAAVASAGADGTCITIVLEEHAKTAVTDEPERYQPLGARSEALLFVEGEADELINGLRELQRFASDRSSRNIEAVGREWLQTHSPDGTKELAIALVPRSFEELIEQIAFAVQGVEANPRHPLPVDLRPAIRDRVFFSPTPLGPKAKIAFVFPGSGNQFDGMGRDLGVQWPEVLRRQQAENDLLRSQFAPEFFWNDRTAEASHCDLMFGQVTVGSLVADLLTTFGIKPDAMIGLSLGESAGLFGIRAWRSRDEMYRRMQASTLFKSDLAPPFDAARLHWGLTKHQTADWVSGVVAASPDDIAPALRPGLRAYLLIVNTANECVIGGERADVEKLAASLGKPYFPLSGVTLAHCEVGKPMEVPYRELHTLPVTAPKDVTVYSGAWGRPYKVADKTAADSITAGLLETIDVPAVVNAAYRDGVRIFLEVGPGSSCTRLIDGILGDKARLARAAHAAKIDAVSQILRLLAGLIAERVPVDLNALYGRESFCLGHGELAVKSGPRIVIPVGAPPVVHAEVPAATILPEPEAEPTTIVIGIDGPVSLATVPSLAPIIAAASDVQTATVQAQAAFLRVNQRMIDSAAGVLRFQTQLLEAWQAGGGSLRPEDFPTRPSGEVPRSLNYEQCCAFAVGKIADVLGPQFAEVDSFPTRVRLPDGPLQLVDRITLIEGEPKSMKPGRVVTEHTVRPDRWYLEKDRIPTAIAVEAGQADLFLSGFLGIDFQTRGLAVYRLLDAVVTFHRVLPRVGETIVYDIRIEEFTKQGDSWLFRFRFDGTVNGAPFITMRNGVAGFFTAEALAAGRGIVHTAFDKQQMPGKKPADWQELVPQEKCSLNEQQVDALRRGDYVMAFGKKFAETSRDRQGAVIPAGMLRLVDRVPRIDPAGGRFGIGFIRAEFDIHPDDWFLTCHFVDDRVMPGTLMYECCLHTLRIFLMRLGWIGDAVCEPIPGIQSRLKCRGQVTETTKTVTYEVTVKELGYGPEPFCVADALMSADGKPIVEITNMCLRMSGLSREKLEATWRGRDAVSPVRSSSDFQFNREHILAYAVGKPSDAFGAPYRPFDSDRIIARLPAPPFAFIDRITPTSGKPFVLEAGAACLGEYDVPPDAWYFAANRCDRMPFSILLEIALQPCGWLAAYCGSALTSDQDMSFRNLGGKATQFLPITPDTGTLQMRARMTNVSRSAGMIIQHYEMLITSDRGKVYEGTTYFGFFTKEQLANQVGIREAKAPWPAEGSGERGELPHEPPFPAPMLRMVDRIENYLPDGGSKGLGLVVGRIAVDPGAWFFQAHFVQDPVWPGSLGLESFLQLLKYAAWKRWGEPPWGWQTTALNRPHTWVYRGQVLPTDREVTVLLEVTAIDEEARRLTANGFLTVDGRVIYQMTDFTLE